MVSSMRVVICFPNSTVGFCADLVCAPAPLLSSSSDNIAAALWNHPLLAKMQENVDQLHKLAVWSSRVNECDGASGNDKLHYSTTSTQSCRSISSCNYEMSVCSNHSQHLVQLGTLTLFGGLDLVNNLFAASLFLSGQGHFRRLLHAVQATVGDLRLVETPRPAECAGYSELCVELLTRHINV